MVGSTADPEPESGPSAPEPITLLYVSTVASTAGHFLAPYAAHFRTLGWRVDVAANGASADSAVQRAFDNVHDLPLSRSPSHLLGLARAGGAVTRAVASGYDIVHVHTPIASFVTRLAVRRLALRSRPMVAYTAHGFHFHRGGHMVTNALFLLAERLAGRWTDRLVVINDEDHAAARRHRIVPPQDLVRMPGIGLDTGAYSRARVAPGAFDRARRELGVPPLAPLFVMVGDLNRNKRPADAVEALARMREGTGHLVFIGDGPERGPVEALAVRRGVGARVRVTGFRDDILPVLGSATALIMPSRREGLARSIMEALALEVPVVASAARGNAELVDADGFVVETGDVQALAESMSWLVDHPDERRAMGARGRARMVQRYDLRYLIALHEELYRGMLEAR